MTLSSEERQYAVDLYQITALGGETNYGNSKLATELHHKEFGSDSISRGKMIGIWHEEGFQLPPAGGRNHNSETSSRRKNCPVGAMQADPTKYVNARGRPLHRN